MPALTKVIHPVHDLAAAKAVYAALLGVEPTMDESYYVGFEVGDQHLGLDPNGHRKGMTGPVGYWQVDDIEKSVQSLTEAGATADRGVPGRRGRHPGRHPHRRRRQPDRADPAAGVTRRASQRVTSNDFVSVACEELPA